MESLTEAPARRRANHTEQHREYLRQRMRSLATKHGHKSGGRPTPEYLAWQNMRIRCQKKDIPNWDSVYYADKGVTVCDRWENSFESFLEDMGDKPSSAHSLDRINGDLGYTPDNCRWATKTEQARNRSNNRFMTANGETKTLAEWCIITGISKGSIRDRIKHGWCEGCAVSVPVNGAKCPHRANKQGESKCAE